MHLSGKYLTKVFFPFLFKSISELKGISPLISALKDEDWRIRWGAAYALGEIKDPRAVEPLIQALKDEDWYVRLRAANALTKNHRQRFWYGLRQVERVVAEEQVVFEIFAMFF